MLRDNCDSLKKTKRCSISTHSTHQFTEIEAFHKRIFFFFHTWNRQWLTLSCFPLASSYKNKYCVGNVHQMSVNAHKQLRTQTCECKMQSVCYWCSSVLAGLSTKLACALLLSLRGSYWLLIYTVDTDRKSHC